MALDNLSATRISESPDGYGFLERAVRRLIKNRDCWCEMPATYKVASSIQPQEYSRGSGIEGISHKVLPVRFTATVTFLTSGVTVRSVTSI